MNFYPFSPIQFRREKREQALSEGMILPPDVVDNLIGLADDIGIETLPFEIVNDN